MRGLVTYEMMNGLERAPGIARDIGFQWVIAGKAAVKDVLASHFGGTTSECRPFAGGGPRCADIANAYFDGTTKRIHLTTASGSTAVAEFDVNRERLQIDLWFAGLEDAGSYLYNSHHVLPRSQHRTCRI